MWGGVSADDGYNAVEYSTGDLGPIYEKFQRHLLNLKKQGFLLSLISKNKENVVWKTLKKRGMILKRNDFIFPQINWNDKSKNILNVLKLLNLRAADAVFIDDSDFEILKVKKSIMDLTLINSKDIIKCYDHVISHPKLQKKNIVDDLKKNKQYILKSNFLELKKNFNDKKMFAKLNQKVYFKKITNQNISRAEQLFNKTNQFNFSVNRRNINEILFFKKKSNFKIRLFGLKDVYGDHGIIGLYTLEKRLNKIFLVDFILSCRVIERYIEYYVINRIFRENKVRQLKINLNLTEANKNMVNKFLSFFFKNMKFLKRGNLMKTIDYNETLKNYLQYFNE